MEQQLFDSTQNVAMTILGPEGEKNITVRQMSDQQIEQRHRSRKVMIRDLGRESSETEITPNETTDLQIFSEIKVDSPELDGAEAGYILDRISETNVVDAAREGTAFRVTVQVLNGVKTTHLLKIPTMRQVQEHRKNVRVINRGYGLKEFKASLTAIGELYDKLVVEKTGYDPASSVPLSHKEAAVSKAFQMLERAHSHEAEDPN